MLQAALVIIWFLLVDIRRTGNISFLWGDTMTQKLISMVLGVCLCNALLLEAMHLGGAGAQAQKPFSMDTSDEEGTSRSRSRECKATMDERSDSPTGKGTKRKTSRSPSPDERKRDRKRARREEAEKVPLISAAKEGDEDQVKKLIAQGADVNTSKNEWSALLQAAEKGHSAIVAELIKKGADVNVQDEEGLTPLMIAYMGIEQSLSESSEFRRTVIININEFESIIDQLLAAKADVNMQSSDEQGATALLIAASITDRYNRFPESMVEKLLQAGAKTQIKDRSGLTAYDVALEVGNVVVANLIQEYEKNSSSSASSAGDDDVEMSALSELMGSAPFSSGSSAGFAAGAGAGVERKRQ